MAQTAFAQHFVECSKCEENAEFYCKNCKKDLCQICERDHLKNTASASHDIVLLQEKYGATFIQEKCSIHSGQVYSLCCQQCQLPICEICREDSKHKKHSFMNLENACHTIREKCKVRVSKIRKEILPRCISMQQDIQADLLSRKEEIDQILSLLTSRGLKMKALIENVIEENERSLNGIRKLQESELEKQDCEITNYIAHLKTMVERFDQSDNKPAEFLFYLRDNPISEKDDVPHIMDIPLPLLTEENIAMEDVIKYLGHIEEVPGNEPRQTKKSEYISYDVPNLQVMDGAEKVKSIKVKGVNECYQISHVSSNKFWVRDENIILSDSSGKTLHQVSNISDEWAIQSVTKEEELIFIDKETNICKLSVDLKKKNILLPNKDPWMPCSIYASRLTGDILVGMMRKKQGSEENSTLEAKVVRLNYSGSEMQSFSLGVAGQALYQYPRYITENCNGDVIVSDHSKNAVVVTDHRAKHRFSYKGPPSSSEFWPRGLCTDAILNILVCDYKTDTVQMIDQNGHFLRLLLTVKDKIDEPCCLSYNTEDNLLLFLGTWHELERTTFQWGDGTWYSQVWTFKRGNDGQLYMAYTGFSPRTQSCTSPNTGLLSGTGGSYTLTSEGRYEAALRVAYTDYENVALVYMCYAPEIQGTCDRTSVHVSLLSRTPSLSTPQRSMLKAHLDLKCVEDHHLNQATTGLNALFYVVN
ncbi:uncharacterized protein LOC133186934 [Saccostrea echinata]|uniref:uncharacterized protein LOC133186934 n=1 Tax=Saccostrea echinata TaxID=191078 RepID=UPI002A81405C|nr:uncharacterized protein LOC133186934 [Saccostrea echinata]